MQHRYPGARPFEFGQKQLYYGRTSDSNNLYRLVKLEPLVVLYGKSGTGKSSLLNAALIPRALSDGYFAPLRVRFSSWQPDESMDNPLVRTWKIIRQDLLEQDSPNFPEKLLPYEQSLWYEIKKIQFNREGKNGILLIFDQFEELFTYPAEQVLEFRRQLAEALFTPVPQRYWDVLEEHEEKLAEILTPRELAIFQQPPDVKVILTIRSDRMHLLHQLNDYFPTILKNCYELNALDETQAAEAIEMPALLPGDFASAPFGYSPEALRIILDFLTDGNTQAIEGTQLQIICSYIEKKAVQRNLTQIEAKHLEDLDGVIENYYEEKIHEIPGEAQQLAARRLIEEGLVFEEEERRISLYEGQIYRIFDIDEDTLRQLVDSHLLRAEPSLQGGYTYELSHDSMVSPVLKAKRKRLEEERRLAEEMARAERERELAEIRRKRQQARLVAVAMSFLAVISLMASIFAFRQSAVAREKERVAVEALDKFQREKAAKERLEIDRLLSEAETFMKSNDFLLAKGRLEQVLQIDTANAPAKQGLEKLQRLLLDE